MDEQTIVEQLRQSIVGVEESTAPTPEVAVDEPINLASTAVLIDLDEITQYKLHDYFGEPYKANDEIARQQLAYIYSEVSKMTSETEYGFIVSKARELERMIGTAQSDNRRQKLYQWLKLDSMRRSIDAQMGTIA